MKICNKYQKNFDAISETFGEDFGEVLYDTRHVSKIRFPTAVLQHEWTKWSESVGIFYFWDAAHTVTIKSQLVQ